MSTGFVVGLLFGSGAAIAWFLRARARASAAHAASLARNEKAERAHARAVRNSIRGRR